MAGEDEVNPPHPLGEGGVQLHPVVGEEDHAFAPSERALSTASWSLLSSRAKERPSVKASGWETFT